MVKNKKLKRKKQVVVTSKLTLCVTFVYSLTSLRNSVSLSAKMVKTVEPFPMELL